LVIGQLGYWHGFCDGLSMYTFDEPQIKHHVRYIDPSCVYHVMSKTWGGLYLMAPKDGVREIITGIVAQSKMKYPEIKLYYDVFLSNHFHLMMQGPGCQFSPFVGSIKREISVRIGNQNGIPGPFWNSRFTSTALPTENSTIECLDYLLSQGSKEDLVERPQDWPGAQGAKQLMYGEKRKGVWFDGTAYAIAKNKASNLKNPPPIKRKDFYQKRELNLDVLPAWKDTPETERQSFVQSRVEKITHKEKTRRQQEGKRILGVKRVKAQSIFKGKTPPSPPFWKDRKRVITAWADLRHWVTQEYTRRYWEFQTLYRVAAEAFKAGFTEPEFPPGAWRPTCYS